MAKKIRFSLEMEQGVEVRTLEELRNNFSLGRVLFYLSNGKLVTWLRDRYEDEIADKITELDSEDSILAEKICEILGVEYNEEVIANLEKTEERNKKLSILKEYTEEQQFLDVVDQVAFTQDDIYDLLDEGETTIYLCGEKFSVPLSKKGMTYIGVNQPIVVIDSKKIIDWDEKDIHFVEVKFDEAYQKIVEDIKRKEEEVVTINDINIYYKNSFLDFVVPKNDKHKFMQCYEKIRNEIEKIDCNFDSSTIRFETFIYNINEALDVGKLMEDAMGVVGFHPSLWHMRQPQNRKIVEERLETIIDNIRKGRYRITSTSTSGRANVSLALVFNYDELNQYGKDIVTYSRLQIREHNDTKDAWWKKYPNIRNSVDEIYKNKAAKSLVNFCQNTTNEKAAYKFIFWTLMVLAVDNRNLVEHLFLICAFAYMLKITEDEMKDMLVIIKALFGDGKLEHRIMTDTVTDLFL